MSWSRQIEWMPSAGPSRRIEIIPGADRNRRAPSMTTSTSGLSPSGFMPVEFARVAARAAT